MTNCIFDSNIAKVTMGGAVFSFGKNIYKSLTFHSNEAQEQGGGLATPWQAGITSLDRFFILCPFIIYFY